MVRWSFSTVACAVRVVAGNVDRQSNEIEIARNGEPLFDEYRSLGLFGMDKSLKWAHIYGTSMQPEGIRDGEFVAYQDAFVVKDYTPTPNDVVLVKIEGEKLRENLHGGYKLRKFISVCDDDPTLFNEVTYDKAGEPHYGTAKMVLIHGKVLFQ